MWLWFWPGWMCAAWHIDEPQQIGSTVAMPTAGATAAKPYVKRRTVGLEEINISNINLSKRLAKEKIQISTF